MHAKDDPSKCSASLQEQILKTKDKRDHSHKRASCVMLNEGKTSSIYIILMTFN